MPEGPEVRKTVDGLAECFLNKEINALRFSSGRYKKKDPTGYMDMLEDLPKLVTGVSCKGKFIYFLFADGSSLWNTLGMSGYWSKAIGKHCRAALSTVDRQTMFYNDMRNFGTFKFVNTQEELDKKLLSIGPDVLSESITVEKFRSCLLKGTRKDKTIAQNLMNQTIISGIGNYLKAEILYNVRISPHRLCKDISDAEFVRLLRTSREVMQLSYASGGATIKNYKSADEKNGVYTSRFAVYNQKNDPLGNKVVREKTPDKRTTHWVPEVQY